MQALQWLLRNIVRKIPAVWLDTQPATYRNLWLAGEVHCFILYLKLLSKDLNSLAVESLDSLLSRCSSCGRVLRILSVCRKPQLKAGDREWAALCAVSPALAFLHSSVNNFTWDGLHTASAMDSAFVFSNMSINICAATFFIFGLSLEYFPFQHNFLSLASLATAIQILVSFLAHTACLPLSGLSFLPDLPHLSVSLFTDLPILFLLSLQPLFLTFLLPSDFLLLSVLPLLLTLLFQALPLSFTLIGPADLSAGLCKAGMLNQVD